MKLYVLLHRFTQEGPPCVVKSAVHKVSLVFATYIQQRK